MGRTNMGMSISIYYRVAQCLIYFSIYFRTTGSSHGLTAALLVAILFGCILLKRVDRKNLDKKVAYRLYLRLCPTRWMGEMKCEYTAVGRCPQVQRELVRARSATPVSKLAPPNRVQIWQNGGFRNRTNYYSDS